jgi:DNA-binding LytR/AlgR family response regulator
MNKETITISSSKGEKKIRKNRIVLCKQYLVGTLLELSDGNHYLLKERVDELQRYLNGSCFFKVSNRELINLDYIEAVFSDQVVLVNNKVLKINDIRKKKLVRKIYDEAWMME